MFSSLCNAKSLMIGGVTALFVGLSAAAPAHADDVQDQIFLTSLKNSGISCSSLPNCKGDGPLISLGRAICAVLPESGDPAAEAKDLVAVYGFTKAQAAGVVRSAIGAYCPQWAGT